MTVAYAVMDLDTGQWLALQQGDTPLIPASTSKVATALFVLNELGPEFRFHTQLLSTGNVVSGVLLGDLILRGGGDASLDVPDLLKMAMRLKQQGIHKVAGRLLVDDGLLPRFQQISDALPLEAPYNASVGALSVGHNRVQLQWKNKRLTALPGVQEAKFSWQPSKAFDIGDVALDQDATLENTLETTLENTSKESEPPPVNPVHWHLINTPNKYFQVQLPVKDPGLHTAWVFRDLAESLAIEVPRPERLDRLLSTKSSPSKSLNDQQEKLLIEHQSASLERLTRDMLIYSNNMMAETLGLMAAQKAHSDVSQWFSTYSLAQAAQLMTPFLRSGEKPDTDSINWDSLVLENFSGLSPKGRMTPKQLVSLIQQGWQQGYLASLLPGSGWTGSLRRRMANNEHRFRVWAKTGSINYGSALTGYLFADSGKVLGFAVMTTDFEARQRYEAQARTPKGERAARQWLRRAQDVQNRWVKQWLKQ